jgi:hypothetical protein
VWAAACGSCHDTELAAAHIDSMTLPSGQESCRTCHGASDELSVAKVHFTP